MASTARAILAVTSLSLCLASQNFDHRRGSLCFSGLPLKSLPVDIQLVANSRDVRRCSASVLRMSKTSSDEGKPSMARKFLSNQAKNIAGLVIAGISSFSAPRFVSAAQSHYNSNDPVIVLPSQEAYAQRAAILNDKDYENPVVRIAKDKRVWAGIGACGVGAGGFFLYKSSEKKKAEQVVPLSQSVDRPLIIIGGSMPSPVHLVLQIEQSFANKENIHRNAKSWLILDIGGLEA
jgi:hypothetical protein